MTAYLEPNICLSLLLLPYGRMPFSGELVQELGHSLPLLSADLLTAE